MIANAIKDTTEFGKDRTLEHLPEFLETFSESPEQLGKAPKGNGAPHTLIVAGAGLRAADLVRYVTVRYHDFQLCMTSGTGC